MVFLLPRYSINGKMLTHASGSMVLREKCTLRTIPSSAAGAVTSSKRGCSVSLPHKDLRSLSVEVSL